MVSTRGAFVVTVVFVALVATVAALVTVDDSKSNADEDVPQSDGMSVSFFIYDNYEHDVTSGLLSENEHLADGYWIRGTGENKKECLLNACDKASISITMEGNDIISINGLSDSNYYQMGWTNSSGWVHSITIGSDDQFAVRYMCIGHGRWIGNEGISGTYPEPGQNPDDLIWYYGESKDTDDTNPVVFYFYDNYSNEGFADPGSIPSSSDTSGFAANGYWVRGFGDSIIDAFEDACAKVYGVIAVSFNEDGSLAKIGRLSLNLYTLLWDGATWSGCNISDVEMSDGLVIAIGHGPVDTSTGALPAPPEGPNSTRWYL